MSILYRVYWNGGGGGTIDYSTPITTTPETNFCPEPLKIPSDNWFGVRSYDPATGKEEENTDVRIRIVIDDQGRDVSRRPNPPRTLFARPTAGGGCRASWIYREVGQGGPPRRFFLTVETNDDPPATVASAIVDYRRGAAYHAYSFSGLLHGRSYTLRAIAEGASDHLRSEAAVASFVARAEPPPAVESLVAIHRQ